jgi:hypothetical protein
MPKFSPEELERAFRTYWETGAVGERWEEWSDLFTEDAAYHERILGSMQGRQAIRDWIVPIMAEYGELYTGYEWHSVDAGLGKVMVYMQNRRDHPSGEGTIDFPGITILDYAGDGRWSQEEDYWALPAARSAQKEYDQAREKFDPEHPAKRTRHHWGNGPDWTRGARTYFDRP